MKKKILFILLVGVFLLSGCGKTSESSIIKDLEKKINNSKSYYIEGTLEIVNNEDLYTYDVKVSYAKGDNYKVNLTNKVNNHEQVILRNSDGVYVVTPRINKSFKFQSDWPYNNSQVYLLKPLLDDILSDENRTFTKDGDNYKIVVAVNYPNNEKLVKQEILLDKAANIKKVTVMDTNGTAQITMNFDKIDLSSKFNDNYFDLKEIIDVKEETPNDNKTTENNTNTNTDKDKTTETKQTSTIEDVIYPMYLPVNTYLSNKEKVSKDNGERLILTFDGDNPFMLIEETVTYEKEHLIVPTYGELELMASTVAIVNDNSVNWIDNNIEYYVVSDKLSKSELLDIARSISVLPVSK
jgi:outer membrane lipoprotein-sorting protein